MCVSVCVCVCVRVCVWVLVNDGERFAVCLTEHLFHMGCDFLPWAHSRIFPFVCTLSQRGLFRNHSVPLRLNNKKQCSRQLQCEVPLPADNVINYSLSSLSYPQGGVRQGEGGLAGGGG